MKVVVLDHPKFLSFFLRKIYGIKKIKDKENACAIIIGEGLAPPETLPKTVIFREANQFTCYDRSSEY